MQSYQMAKKTNDKREQALDAISKDPFRIIKGNPIINAKFDITAIQMKIFLHMIASIDQAKDSVPIIKITVKDFQKLTGINSNNIYAHVEKEAMKMREKRIFFSNSKITFDANLISAFVYYKDEGYFTLEIPQALHPFLLQIKENFTVLDIRNILRLDSVYAMRFYEFCKEYERFGKFRFGVDELKATLGLSNRYKNYFDFKKKVVEQARKELSESAEIFFEFEELKVGKKVETLEFTIISNRKISEDLGLPLLDAAGIPTLLEPAPNVTVNPNVEKIFNKVQQYGISLQTVENWLNELPLVQVELGIDYVFKELNRGKNILNVGGYLNQMVRSATLQEEEKRNQEKVIAKQKQLAKTAEQQVQVQAFEAKKEALKVAFLLAKKEVALKLLKADTILYVSLLEKIQNSLFGEISYRSFISYCENSISFDSFINFFIKDDAFSAVVLNIMEQKFVEISSVKMQFEERAKQLKIKLI